MTIETKQKFQSVVYMFAEQGNRESVYIGRCSKGGWTSFKDASYVNPQQIDVLYMWKMSDNDAARDATVQARKLLQPLSDSGSKAWRRASPSEAVSALASFLGDPDYTKGTLPFSTSDYYREQVHDDLRERGDRYKGRLVQMRIWIHEEQAGPFRKISHNTWWCEESRKSSNSKPVPYNPRQLEPVACYAIGVDEQASDWAEQVRVANTRTLKLYPEIVDAFGIKDKPTGRAGWTIGRLSDICAFLQDLGLVALHLDPKSPPKGVKSLKYPTR